ncbi:MAG TPA: hypothetical protein VNH11_33815 [Pirellulales bacterium]|nr:hypothetical protein [Pirellulales bacterium]
MLALAVIFSFAGTLGFAVTPPAGPWWWTSAFVHGQLGLLSIWAALGAAPWWARWPCWFAGVELAGLHIHPDAWSQHLRWLEMPHALFTFVLLSLLREFATWKGKVRPIRQFTLRRLFALTAMTALALWAWNHRAQLLPRRGWPETTVDVGGCLSLTAIDLIAVWMMRRPLARWWSLALIVAVILVQSVLWHFYDPSIYLSWRGIVPSPWSYHLCRIAAYDASYLAPIFGVLAGYRWTAAATSTEGA